VPHKDVENDASQPESRAFSMTSKVGRVEHLLCGLKFSGLHFCGYVAAVARFHSMHFSRFNVIALSPFAVEKVTFLRRANFKHLYNVGSG
jgi:hypothetical protein